MKNLYIPELAVVEEIKEETPSISTLSISLESGKPLKSLPGQFVELTLFGYGEFPVSVSSVPESNKGIFQSTIQRIGKVTREISHLAAGAKVGVRGPFGNGFSLEAMRGSDICVITGGVGLAAVKDVLNKIVEDRDQYGKLQLLHGARTPTDLIFKDFLFDKARAEKEGIEILLTVDKPDETWKGHTGVVTGLLDKTEIDPTRAIAVICGPAIMMKYAIEAISKIGFDDDRILLSMERRMQCGMGVCGHCMIGQKRVCMDGPIFTYAEIRGSIEKVF